MFLYWALILKLSYKSSDLVRPWQMFFHSYIVIVRSHKFCCITCFMSTSASPCRRSWRSGKPSRQCPASMCWWARQSSRLRWLPNAHPKPRRMPRPAGAASSASHWGLTDNDTDIDIDYWISEYWYCLWFLFYRILHVRYRCSSLA